MPGLLSFSSNPNSLRATAEADMNFLSAYSAAQTTRSDSDTSEAREHACARGFKCCGAPFCLCSTMRSRQRNLGERGAQVRTQLRSPKTRSVCFAYFYLFLSFLDGQRVNNVHPKFLKTPVIVGTHALSLIRISVFLLGEVCARGLLEDCLVRHW